MNASAFFITLTDKELERMAQLQSVDSLNCEVEPSAWDIMEVIAHRVALTPRLKDGRAIASKHLRVKVKFRDGGSSWVQADAVQSDTPFPLIQYVVRNKLTNHKWFHWVKVYLDNAKDLDNREFLR